MKNFKSSIRSLLAVIFFANNAFAIGDFNATLREPVFGDNTPYNNVTLDVGNDIIFDGFEPVISFTNVMNSISLTNSKIIYTGGVVNNDTINFSGSSIAGGVSIINSGEILYDGLDGAVIKVFGIDETHLLTGNIAITNSGEITNIEDRGVVIKVENTAPSARLIITNSGLIRTFDQTSNPLAISSSAPITLNIRDGSSVVGGVFSSAAGNVVNMQETNLNIDSFNDRLIGDWIRVIDNAGYSSTIAANQTLGTASGALNGSEKIKAGLNAGSITNNGTAEMAIISGGTFTNNNLLTLTLLSGGSVINNGTANTINSISGGTLTNNGTIGEIQNLSGGTLIQNGSTTINSIVQTGGVIINNSGNRIRNISFSDGSIDNMGTIATLKLNSAQALGNIRNSGSILNLLTGNGGFENITYSDTLSGSGSFTKIGTGRLEIVGNANTHNGAFNVAAGELKVNGTTASLVTIESGAVMSGSGTIGALTLNSGGVLASGNSIGTLHVVGALNLNAGSISNFEFNETGIDKTIAGGNITIADGAIANFSLYNTQGGYFVLEQNILETTGGAVSGQFAVVTSPDDYAIDLQYNTQNVRATIARKVDGSVIDGALTSQNIVGRMLNKTVFEKLLDAKNICSEDVKVWISSGGFNNQRNAAANASNNNSNGVVTSAGLIKNYKSFQLIGGIFNAQSNAKHLNYSADDIDTNGVLLGVGKSFGGLYLLAQSGVGFYDLSNSRQVNVGGLAQSAKGNSKGLVKYFSLGASYKLPINISGELALFGSTRLQKTTNDGWQENGLSSGNLKFAQSSANTSNYEFGTSYQNKFAQFFHLPEDSFFRVELSGFKSKLLSKKDTVVTMGSAQYNLTPNYEEKILTGINGYVSVPLLRHSTNFVASVGKRQNGRYKEVSGNLGFEVSF